MEAITALLELVQQIAGTTSDSGVLGKIIGTLAEAAPLAIKEYRDVMPIIKNITTALSQNGAITPEQMADLKQLDEKVDAAFDAAAAAAEAEDAAADKNG